MQGPFLERKGPCYGRHGGSAELEGGVRRRQIEFEFGVAIPSAWIVDRLCSLVEHVRTNSPHLKGRIARRTHFHLEVVILDGRALDPKGVAILLEYRKIIDREGSYLTLLHCASNRMLHEDAPTCVRTKMQRNKKDSFI